MKKFTKLLTTILACCVTILPCKAQLSEPISVSASTAQGMEYAEIVVSAVNDIRVQNGLQPVALLPELVDVCEIRAQELAQSFSHTRPDGNSCFTAVRSADIFYSLCAENIAGGRVDPISTVSQLMDSTGHRENILNPRFTHIGMGYYYEAGTSLQHHWCMLLIEVRDGEDAKVLPSQYIPSREKGDVNGSKSINASDASKILQYAASCGVGRSYPVVPQFEYAADVNGDGKINSVDACIILQYSAAKGTDPSVTLDSFIWN